MRAPASKTALGRGLGTLMKEPSQPALAEKGALQPVSITPGVASLLRVGNGASRPEPKPAPPSILSPLEPQFAKRLVQVSLVAGDLLLLALVAWFWFGTGGNLSALQVLLCAIGILLGAWLSCLALWLD